VDWVLQTEEIDKKLLEAKLLNLEVTLFILLKVLIHLSLGRHLLVMFLLLPEVEVELLNMLAQAEVVESGIILLLLVQLLILLLR
jgi:hypothetical protein